MSIIETLAVSLFGIALVFFVLACLFALVKALSKVLSKIENKKVGISIARNTTAPVPAEAGEEADANSISAGELKLINVDEKTAAMIMAILSHESQIPLSELSFRSIKAMEES